MSIQRLKNRLVQPINAKCASVWPDRAIKPWLASGLMRGTRAMRAMLAVRAVRIRPFC